MDRADRFDLRYGSSFEGIRVAVPSHLEDEVEALDEEELKGVRKPSALAHLWAPSNYPEKIPTPPSTTTNPTTVNTTTSETPTPTLLLSLPAISRPPRHAYEYEGSVPPGGASGSKPIKRYPCKQPGCNRSFTRLFNLKAHMETHNPDRERSFKCEHCGVAFCRAQDLLRHGTVHDKTNLMVCPACPTKTFSRKDALRRHIRVNGCCPLDSI
ncbi:hypothetical protein BC829DRAFT_439613 [Chytridium lagenaria]|nr:hypothetical protein BC829DRAFT_439613 [Chytridium lagenaria]